MNPPFLGPTWAAAGCLLFISCASSNTNLTSSSSVDLQMSDLMARVEQAKTQESLNREMACADEGAVCKLAADVCTLASKAAERLDFQKDCVSAQEECARVQAACRPTGQ